MRNRWMVFTCAVMTAAILAVPWESRGVRAQAPAAAYSPPRTPDGRPDLQGIWQALNTAVWNIQDHNAAPGVPAGLGVVVGNDLPYLPAALKQRQENFRNRATEDPEAKCFMVGVPRLMYMPYPMQIVQSPQMVAVLSEYAHAVRYIRLQGAHPRAGEWYLGDSRGRWEGDTLVVDVTNFVDGIWLDRSGNFHSDALHVVERFTRTGPDHLQYEATIEDAKTFAKPWKMSMMLYRRKEPNLRLLEYECYNFFPQK